MQYMKKHYHIRPASEADQPHIHDIVRRARIKPFDLKWSRFLLAETEAGEVIGCGQIKNHRDGSRELASIAVEEAWRHRGIASELIEKLLVGVAEPVWLICQGRLVGFYERFGFAEKSPTEETPKHLRRAFRAARLFKRLIPGIGKIAIMVKWDD
jgi:N-acetylglutamate synthase-like GNAT family acetyltransferase